MCRFIPFLLFFISQSFAEENLADLSKHKCFLDVKQTIANYQDFPTWERLTENSFSSFNKDNSEPIFLEKFDDEVKLVQTKKMNRVVISWNMITCDKKLTIVPPPNIGNYFFDEDMKTLMKANQKGMIYIWSPQMPLSFEGIERIRKISKDLKLPLTVLLDPSVSDDKNFKKIYSFMIEKIFKNLHYPTLLLYKNGKLLRKILPGLADEQGYKKFIQGNL